MSPNWCEYSRFHGLLQDGSEVGQLPAVRATRMVVERVIWPFPLAFWTHSSSWVLLNAVHRAAHADAVVGCESKFANLL